MIGDNEKLDLVLAFGGDVREDDLRAQELYAALCNNRWVGRNKVWEFSWRQAGDFVAAIRNERIEALPETYLDYYASGQEGIVAPWVRSRFLSIGYREAED